MLMPTYFILPILIGLAVSQSIQSVQDSSGNYYFIGHQSSLGLPAYNCYIEKFSQGKSVWRVVYDNSTMFCQGHSIYRINDNIYAIFKVNNDGSKWTISKNIATGAPDAFATGLWNQIDGIVNSVDAIVSIDTDDGSLSSGTFLVSKTSGLLSLLSTKNYSIQASYLYYSSDGLKIKCQAADQTPGANSDRDSFVPASQIKSNAQTYVVMEFDLSRIRAVYNA